MSRGNMTMGGFQHVHRQAALAMKHLQTSQLSRRGHCWSGAKLGMFMFGVVFSLHVGGIRSGKGYFWTEYFHCSPDFLYCLIRRCSVCQQRPNNQTFGKEALKQYVCSRYGRVRSWSWSMQCMRTKVQTRNQKRIPHDFTCLKRYIQRYYHKFRLVLNLTVLSAEFEFNDRT